ncbi:septum-promoting GTP-binding protein 1-like [Mercurialis annua]|uniref:septum-promoting GTP-binding protein 1-like n=1 Tax=Mercurialis annua TaxID=3986 RepID=UPI0021600FF9|nr:septum-promoting GTP-binding protein 1-like [Mercurialis annua]
MVRVRVGLRHKIQRRIIIFRRCILRAWNQIKSCSLGKPIQYQVFQHPVAASSPVTASEFTSGSASPPSPPLPPPPPPVHNRDCDHGQLKDSDLVALKISLVGDCQIGKTSFLAKYVGNETLEEKGSTVKDGMNVMDKTLMIEGARISFSLWEVRGDHEGYKQQMPLACKDSVAILIMFDLTSRVTLNSVISWYQEARKWNQNAIPIIIGTKFDEFIQLPIDLQWTIASQARGYAKAVNATLFFSSATYNINVNKIFKFIIAKLFDLPWTPERNLTIGEPIIDF